MSKRCKLCGGQLVKLSGDYPKVSEKRKRKTARYKTPNYKCIDCGQVYEDTLKMIDTRVI